MEEQVYIMVYRSNCLADHPRNERGLFLVLEVIYDTKFLPHPCLTRCQNFCFLRKTIRHTALVSLYLVSQNTPQHVRDAGNGDDVRTVLECRVLLQDGQGVGRGAPVKAYGDEQEL